MSPSSPETIYKRRWAILASLVLSLTVVRMVPVALALAGAGLDRFSVAFVGWFGPRGLASVMVTDLSQVGAVRVLERNRIQCLLDELRFTGRSTSPTGGADPGSVELTASLERVVDGSEEISSAAPRAGVLLGTHFAVRVPHGFLRGALGTVMIAAAITLITKEQPPISVVAPSLAVAGLTIGAMFAVQIGLHRQRQRRLDRTREAPAAAG